MTKQSNLKIFSIILLAMNNPSCSANRLPPALRFSYIYIFLVLLLEQDTVKKEQV